MRRMNVQALESELWEAADQLRANSKLTAAEYAMPVLGLIFLRHADNRFQAVLPELEASLPPQLPPAQREELLRLGFAGRAAIYLPAQARFEAITHLPEGVRVGEAIDAAMEAIEADHPVLAGALPRGYTGFEPDLLAGLVKIFDRPALRRAQGDVFGRIYEYFLNKFAMTGAQEGGEFFTPPSLVRLIVNVIEPDHGQVFDPACGSAGMFVQTGHFIEEVRHGAAHEVTFFGQEKSDTNTRLARMNLVVHGLDASNIVQGNTFYDQAEHLIGQCDFVMANPPFNVDGVDTKKVLPQVGGRLPFGLPGTNGKSGAISNANSLWIQYFYSYLNAQGRAGFVMASSASDAGNKDREIREQLVKTGHVDVMVAIGTKFFYTRSLPCTLWFFDKGKAEDLLDRVLMVDARNVYHAVSARSHVFTEEQLANLTAITWLYRGQNEKFTALVRRYQAQVAQWLAALPARVAADAAAVAQLAGLLSRFAEGATLEALNAGVEEEAARVSAPALAAFRAEVAQGAAELAAPSALAPVWARCAEQGAALALALAAPASHTAQARLQPALEALAHELKAAGKTLEAQHKRWLGGLEHAEKQLRARNSKAFDAKAAREARRALQSADAKKEEPATARDNVLEALRQAVYFIHQIHWLHSRFPHGLFEDVPGLCRAVPLEEIEANDYSLTPGRYVGVAPAGSDDDEDDFAERLREIHGELAELNDKAVELAARIAANFEELVG